MLDSIQQFDVVAQGDREIFLRLFDGVKKIIKDNPDMLYKRYWK